MEAISEFYEKYPFPGIRPIDQDGLILLRSLNKYIQLHSTNNRQQLRILDAGCGTGNTSISLAKHFSNAQYLGLDISKNSLSQARRIARKEKIANLNFRQWNLMDPLTDEETFDIILCLGVLHHTASMKKVLINLKRVLKPYGELYLWIYGKHGRYRHSLNQKLLNLLLGNSLKQESTIQIAKDFVLKEKRGSIMEDLVGQKAHNEMLKKVMENEIWIADQFLNPQEVVLDMEELINLLDDSGFDIKKWLGVNDDLSSYFNSSDLSKRFKQLSRNQRFAALDFLLKPDQYFVVLEQLKG